jgi:antitoxin (DNA-binding transcriptional repressor) of toxin-antitoxin stability system
MERIRRTRQRVIITKRNVPVAQMVPIEKKGEERYETMKGSVHFKGDIIKPIGEEWDADS